MSLIMVPVLTTGGKLPVSCLCLLALFLDGCGLQIAVITMMTANLHHCCQDLSVSYGMLPMR